MNGVLTSMPAEGGEKVETGKAGTAVSSVEYEFRHFPQLDGFRGLAVVLVLGGHTLAYGSFGPRLTDVGHALAGSGVFLFFVLSDFLITGLLYHERQEKGRIDL